MAITKTTTLRQVAYDASQEENAGSITAFFMSTIDDPDDNELPIPKEKIEQTDINENEFKILVTQTNQDTKSDSNEDVDKNFEELLLDKIKKN